ncbi:MAG: DNA methyltransferase [Candidatus Methanomethylicaceae archaeon]
MDINAPKDSVVLDPMCGSGTTLVVAKNLAAIT